MDIITNKKIKQINSQLSDITNQTNDLKSKVGNGSPEPFATLTALQTAYPTGTTGIKVVTVDGGWYYWNGSAWTKGGTYQSSGIANSSVTDVMLSDTGIKLSLGNWLYSIGAYSDWQTINVNGTWNSGDTITVKVLASSNISYFVLYGIDSGGNATTIASSLSPSNWYNYTLSANYTTIRVAIKLTAVTQGVSYYAIVKKVGSGDSLSDEVIRYKATLTDQTNKLDTIDSPFVTSTIINNAMKGIVAFYFLENTVFPLSNNQKYRITSYYYKKSGYYLYLNLQAYIGGAWGYFDSIEISDVNAPVETAITIVTSKYGRFKCALIPALLSSYSSTTLNYEIKYTSVPYMYPKQQSDIDALKVAMTIEDFGFKDKPKRIINVDASGKGDYTTISAVYASITDSDFDNQYDIRVFPGVYNEMNLVPPKFTHTHGLHPNTVTVTGVGLNNPELSIFDLVHTAKLSNMTIIATENMRYAVHFDSGDGGRFAICENLYCKKVYGATTDIPLGVDVRNNGWLSYSSNNVIGMGMSGAYQIAFVNCVFENGLVISHTNANTDSYPDAKIIFDGCKLVNSYMRLQTAGTAGQYPTNGKYICTIKNLITQIGKTSLEMTFYGNDKPWTVIGDNNDNFSIKFIDINGTGYEAWENINTTDKGYVQLASGVSVLKGQWIDYNGNICNNSSAFEVFGVALENKVADAKESVMVWIGNAYPYTVPNGEYGIGSDGNLSASAITKIGKVINNIFYRY